MTHLVIQMINYKTYYWKEILLFQQ